MMPRARRTAFVVAMATAGLLLSSPAEAAPGCTVSTTGVSFGSYDVFGASSTDSTGSVTYNCSGGARNISITLSKGVSTTFSPRTMTSGSNTLSYNLYTDAARSVIWGDGTSGTQTYTDANPPNNRNIVVTIYGRIPAGQDVAAGSYSDTVTAIINF